MKRAIALHAAGAVALLAALACAPAQAQTLYKLIDRNGKVTYAQEAPKDFDGKVIRIDVNPNANTATLPKFQPPATKPRAAAGSTDVRALRERVAERKAALEHAQNDPAEEDVQWVGNAGGGTRRVPTESYRRRLAELERSLKEAEDELHAAEKNAR
ncbi:MAG TPA: DUF4124 domain-containing protein [Usitatibacter sp.]|jgi:hypothetical protein|nr:DUF4124 domain-containing protein [Usitatibacter sp.]